RRARGRARRGRPPLQADAPRLAPLHGRLRLRERDLELDRPAVALNGHGDLGPALGARHGLAQVVAVGDRIAAELDDHVAGPDPGLRGRAVGVDGGHQHACLARELEVTRELLADLYVFDAELALPGAELVDEEPVVVVP